MSGGKERRLLWLRRTRSSRLRGTDRGFSLVELLVTVAVIGIAAAVAVPSFVNYLQASALRAGAEELVSILNVARSTAVMQNSLVCVDRDAATNRVRLLIAANNPCSAVANFYGANGNGADARVGPNGWMTMQNGVSVTDDTAAVIFNYLGAAVPGGTYTVTQSGRTLRVVVAPSGRITIAP